MSERRKVLELFEANKEETQKRVAEGIEKYRKGDVKITVVDESGNAIPNAKVSIKQKSHEFRFGANIFMLDEMETDEKNEAYKKHFADVFNMATLPFYWSTLEPERAKPRYDKDSPKVYRRPAPDLCMEFCEQNGIEPREHALAYEHFYPKWLSDAPIDEAKAAYENRCREISERYADKIPTIEVVNEMGYRDNGITTLFKDPDFIKYSFDVAEKYFPNNQLGINEETNRCWADNCLTTDKYYAYIEANMLKGARIDAIGMQYHGFYKSEVEYEQTRKIYDPNNLYAHMDLYARFGKPLQVTEITIPAYTDDAEDEAIQAEIIENLYPIWFSHPAMEQIIYWNLVDGYAYVSSSDPIKIRESQGNMSLGENYYRGGLFRFDLTPKPAYNVIKRLITEVWHTEEQDVTNECGGVSFRGFYGDYEVEIETDNRIERKTVKLSKNCENNFTLAI